MRRCSTCQVEKDESEFYVYKKTGTLWGKCKKCHVSECVARAAADVEESNARTNRWRAANPGRTTANIRAWQLRNPERHKGNVYKCRYRVDLQALWDAQSGTCAACCEPMLGEGREPSSVCVDHDRSCCPGGKSCGKCVRGLIHRNCNLVLGYAKDDVKVLRSAVIYLESWKTTGPRNQALEPSTLPSLAAVVTSHVGPSRAWQLRNPDRFKAQMYKSRFNIDFNAMWAGQDGLCASCGVPMQEGGKDPPSVCVDHDRACCPSLKSCGKCVRGLIHRNCNLVLGYAKDNLTILRCAIEYLERWGQRQQLM